MTYRPLPVRLSVRCGEKKAGGFRRQALAFVFGLLALLLSAGPAFADPSVEAKRAEAQRIMNELQVIDGRLGQAVEAYNLASTKLSGVQDDLRANTRRLRVAKTNLHVAQRRLSERVVSIYKGEEVNSTLEIILGAESLQDIVNRLDTVGRVSSHDTRVMRQVRAFRRDVKRTQVTLKRAEAAQRRLVAERAARKRSIESQLAQRQQLLASVKDEIAQLQAEERERQAALARRLQQSVSNQAGAALTSADEVVTTEVSEEYVAPPSRYGGVIGIAMQYLGVPYVWGGSSPSGFDCSGFTMYVYAQVGVSLPHNAAMQYGVGVPVSRDQLQAGDLVFFNGLGHMGMYIGGGNFIHAPHTGDVVKISSLNEGWYLERWVGARRVT
jgi:cell wall-associated NlpC family hydrolase